MKFNDTISENVLYVVYLLFNNKQNEKKYHVGKFIKPKCRGGGF